jgi:hypothetical protein
VREITPSLTPELERHVGISTVAKAEPYPMPTYRALIEQSARLAYLNRDHLLFFRGQRRDYKNRAGASSFYPSIYRDDMLRRDEVALRFRTLDRAAAQLRSLFKKGQVEGHSDLTRKRWVQWSVLQHYEVTPTPLLDVTHSPRVACSFATMDGGADHGLVFVFGLPYMTNRITINSEQDTALVRLLSICPPSAIRPYFQEGYLVGTPDLTSDYEDKSEFDLNRRLIATFSIPTKGAFWGRGLRGLSKEELSPSDDTMKDLCGQIRLDEAEAGDLEEGGHTALGEFVASWAGLERILLRVAQRGSDRLLSTVGSTRELARKGIITPEMFAAVDRLRRMRNTVVHGHERASDVTLREAVDEIATIRKHISRVERNQLLS